jgi:hypothetical protein
MTYGRVTSDKIDDTKITELLGDRFESMTSLGNKKSLFVVKSY